MTRARFRFHDHLSLFLARELQGLLFEYQPARAATLKNAIEALGVPHTEVGRVTVNALPATLQRIVREGDQVEVHPWRAEEETVADPIFLADAHLGGLARFLRMAGFDTVHQNAISDAEIRRLAVEERRIVLTRDRELLKCADIARGACVRALKPEAQLREIAERYGLAAAARPFRLCLHCNLPLEPIDKLCIRTRLPQQVSLLHDSFMHCHGCDRVYWRGSHYEKMHEQLGSALGRTPQSQLPYQR